MNLLLSILFFKIIELPTNEFELFPEEFTELSDDIFSYSKLFVEFLTTFILTSFLLELFLSFLLRLLGIPNFILSSLLPLFLLF